jgi:putative ABC transport system ATP-binding protein
MRTIDVKLAFGKGQARTMALAGVDLTLEPGIFTIITGPSGSGKTSLLSIIGSLIRPDSGRVVVDGLDIAAMSDSGRAAFRREKIGFVFQSFRLLPALSAEENIRMSLSMRGLGDDRRKARSALATVGLGGKAHLLPDALSGGEKQRVAVARALAHDPPFLLADEPTSSLDKASGLQVVQLLSDTLVALSRVLVVVTHDERVMPFAKRVVAMEDGKVVADNRSRGT